MTLFARITTPCNRKIKIVNKPTSHSSAFTIPDLFNSASVRPCPSMLQEAFSSIPDCISEIEDQTVASPTSTYSDAVPRKSKAAIGSSENSIDIWKIGISKFTLLTNQK